MSTDPSFTFNAERPSRSKVILELSNDLGKVTLENKVTVRGADYSKDASLLTRAGMDMSQEVFHTTTTKTTASSIGATRIRTSAMN